MRRAAPKTRLAAVQSVWADAVGGRIAAVAVPVSERDEEVTVACEDPVWAQELDLMRTELLERLGTLLGDQAPRNLRFRAETVPAE